MATDILRGLAVVPLELSEDDLTKAVLYAGFPPGDTQYRKDWQAVHLSGIYASRSTALERAIRDLYEAGQHESAKHNVARMELSLPVPCRCRLCVAIEAIDAARGQMK